MADVVTTEQRGDVAVVRVDRPPANALDLELLEAGHRAASELRAADSGAVVIVGRERFFSAGVDLKAVTQLDAAGQRALVEGISRLFLEWYSFPRPVVCAINGHAVAGGMIIALCGDYRVCTRAEAKLGLTEVRAGVPYPEVAMAIVRAELSPPAARVVALGAELVGPEAALGLGLVDELCDPEGVLDRAVELATGYAALPPAGYAYAKEQMRGDTIRALRRIVDERADPLLRQACVDEESAGAASAILERR